MGYGIITRRGLSGGSPYITEIYNLPPDKGLPGVSIPRSYFEVDGNYVVALDYKSSYIRESVEVSGNLTLSLVVNVSDGNITVINDTACIIFNNNDATLSNGGIHSITVNEDYIEVAVYAAAPWMDYLYAIQSATFTKGGIFHSAL